MIGKGLTHFHTSTSPVASHMLHGNQFNISIGNRSGDGIIRVNGNKFLMQFNHYYCIFNEEEFLSQKPEDRFTLMPSPLLSSHYSVYGVHVSFFQNNDSIHPTQYLFSQCPCNFFSHSIFILFPSKFISITVSNSTFQFDPRIL